MERQHAVRLGVLIGCWVGAVVCATGNGMLYVHHWNALGGDAHAYWLAGRSAHPYGLAPGEPDAFLYSPLFAQCMRPLAMLPWPVFLGLWMASETAAFCWLVAPLRWAWRVPLVLLASGEVMWGNIYGLMAVAVAIGLRYPAAWSFALLTKITPAVPGALWFAVRGEWRSLLQFAGTSTALIAISAAISPHLWIEWVQFLLAHRGQSGAAWIRMLVSLPLVIVAARLDKPALLPLACFLWLPRWGGQIKDVSYAIGAARFQPVRIAKSADASSDAPTTSCIAASTLNASEAVRSA